MSVQLEYMNSFVIPIARLYACPEISNVDRFLEDHLEIGQRDESLLVIPGGQNQMDTMLALEHFKSIGLKPTKKKKGVICWHDLCVVDSACGPTLQCDWLEWDPTTSSVSMRSDVKSQLMQKPVKGTVVFAHGKESGPSGDKLMALSKVARKLGFRVIIPDFRGIEDPDRRVEYLMQAIQAINGPFVLAGSSMGGYVALKASQNLETSGLFLMAPAIGLPGYADQMPVPGCNNLCIVHAWQDEIIPAQQVISWAEKNQAELHLVESDHRLTSVKPLLCSLIAILLNSVKLS